MLMGVPGSSPITDPRLPPKRTRSKGPFLRQHDPASPVVWPSPTPVRPAACAAVGLPAPSRDGSPPMTRTTLPPCRAPDPGGSRRVPVSIASPLTRPSPFPRRVGIRIFTFEACSGFTRVTARWIAEPPRAAFVTRLRPGRFPGQAARQLPEQSTTLWVEPSSTGDPRRRGALQKSRLLHHGPGPVRPTAYAVQNSGANVGPGPKTAIQQDGWYNLPREDRPKGGCAMPEH